MICQSHTHTHTQSKRVIHSIGCQNSAKYYTRAHCHLAADMGSVQLSDKVYLFVYKRMCVCACACVCVCVFVKSSIRLKVGYP